MIRLSKCSYFHYKKEDIDVHLERLNELILKITQLQITGGKVNPGSLGLNSSLLSTKKMHDVRIKFYLGQNEDCSPGDSTSESSERLLQRGSGGRSIYKIG